MRLKSLIFMFIVCFMYGSISIASSQTLKSQKETLEIANHKVIREFVFDNNKKVKVKLYDDLDNVLVDLDLHDGYQQSIDLFRTEFKRVVVGFWLKTGNFAYINPVVDGKTHGSSQQFYENGKIQYERVYEYGKKKSEKKFDENGVLLYKTELRNEDLAEIGLYPNGNKKYEVLLKYNNKRQNWEKNGEAIYYDENGKVVSKRIYELDPKMGIVGKETVKINDTEGIVKTYLEDGRLYTEERMNLVKNTHEGITKVYDLGSSDGSYMEVLFENNVPVKQIIKNAQGIVDENATQKLNRDVAEMKTKKQVKTSGNCPKEKPLFDGKNCYSCDEPGIVNDHNCSTICPNRRWGHVLGGNTCFLKECPKSHPLRAEFGSCLDCEATDIWIHQSNCEEVCPNRELSAHGMCVPKVCPPDKPLRRYDGVCRSCDEEIEIHLANDEDCSKLCPNRTLFSAKYLDYKLCVFKDCPEGTVRMEIGDCRPCQNFIDNSSTVYPLDPKDCARCPNLMTWGKECVAKECPGDWRNNRGRCACEDVTYLDVDDPKKCTLCGYEAIPVRWAENKWECKKKKGE